jgi:hypothetical protein
MPILQGSPLKVILKNNQASLTKKVLAPRVKLQPLPFKLNHERAHLQDSKPKNPKPFFTKIPHFKPNFAFFRHFKPLKNPKQTQKQKQSPKQTLQKREGEGRLQRSTQRREATVLSTQPKT